MAVNCCLGIRGKVPAALESVISEFCLDIFFVLQISHCFSVALVDPIWLFFCFANFSLLLCSFSGSY